MTEINDQSRRHFAQRALRVVSEQPWAMHPEMFSNMVADLRSGMIVDVAGASSDDDGAAPEARTRSSRAGGGGAVAVLPIMGTIRPRPMGGLLGMLMGGTSVVELRAMLRQAVSDEQVGAIVLDVDSPGGSVDGMPEMAAEIRKAATSKPIVAISDTWAASGAYWLASQASEFLVSPSGQVGSIGVYATHRDYSAMDAQRGVKTTFVSAGKYKVEGNDTEPLSPEAREHLQGMVDSYYDMFVSDVARGRDVSDETVREKFGQGRMVMAADAKKAGMVDGIGTLDDAVGRAGRLAQSNVARARVAERMHEPAVRDWLRDGRKGTSSGGGHSSPRTNPEEGQ